MEEQIKELEVFKKGIEHLKEALSYFKDCNNEDVTVDEYMDIESLLNDFTDRAMKLEIEIKGCILEEI